MTPIPPLTPPLALNTPGELSSKLPVFTPYVSSLPVRRKVVAENAGRSRSEKMIRESVILRHELATEPGWILLRVKHVAVDFCGDFDVSAGTVPGRVTIGKMHKYPIDGPWLLADKFLVFPHSRCLHENGVLCNNCTELQKIPDRDSYENHRKWPCTQNPTYGRDIAGGLQDFMQIRLPIHSLIKVSEHVSVHDCCFLLDISLPFYSFCQDTLCELLAKTPASRILILLNDSTKEANDCLLVIHHLNLDHLRFTFCDVNAIKSPELLQKYTNKFTHVLVFARLPQAYELGLRCGVSTGLAISKNRHTLTFFVPTNLPVTCHQDHPDKSILQVSLSYKDRFLLERLLDSMSDLNFAHNQTSDNPVRSQSQTLENLLLSGSSVGSTKKRLRFKNQDEIIDPIIAPRRNLRWLHCDHDFSLCLDHLEFDQPEDCHLGVTINEMLRLGCKLRRVFYTNRPLFHPSVNALIVSPVLPDFL